MDTILISKADAIAAYDGNAAALARALKITPSAIYQWPDGPIAEGYALKLRYVLKADVFGDEASRQPPAAPAGSAAAEAAAVVPVDDVDEAA